MKILIIEDDKTCSEMLQKFLQQHQEAKIEFVAAHTLSEGFAQTGLFDLIILDLVLPDSPSPEETLERFSETMKKVPTIVVSGMEDIGTGMMAIERGAKELVSKANLDGLTQAFNRFAKTECATHEPHS